MQIKKRILYCDLKRQFLSIEDEINNSVKKVLYSGRFILGKEVENFEKEFAEYCDSHFGIGVASGTDALHISLLACGVKEGDEVVTVANAGIPMVAAITLAGAVPVFVDINPKSYTMDVSKIEEKISRKTRAILPVHLYGQCADMEPILRIAKKYGLKVIEDACQAHGATYRNKKAGQMGDIGCFSFYPTKNLGCYGDGGMMITNDKVLGIKGRMLRDYGQTRRYHHVLKGLNSRLDELQAAILRVKLKHLDAWNEKRIELAKIYNDNIKNDLIVKPHNTGYGIHIYHLYVVTCRYRDRLQKYLLDNGIESGIHYPIPAYRQKAYVEFKPDKPCKVTEQYAKMVLSLPLYSGIAKEEIYYICKVLNKFEA